MTTTPQCSNCFFSFVAPLSADTLANNRGAVLEGVRFCNRQAPSASSQNPNGWLWPQVADDWWCGEGADSATGLSYGDGVSGIPGTGGAGPGYLATSTTNLTIASSGSLAPVTQLNLAYTPGARVRLTSTGSAAWMEGVVTNYSAAGTLTFTADLSSGSGAHTDWSINLAGAQGAAGTTTTTGSFTLSAVSQNTLVLQAAVTGSSIVVFSPTSVTAAQLMITAANIYVSAQSAGVSFTVTTADGSRAAGTETFDYLLVG